MNHLVFLHESYQGHEFVSHPLVYVGLILGLWFTVMFLFFVHELNPFKECERATLTNKAHVLLYFDQLIRFVK